MNLINSIPPRWRPLFRVLAAVLGLGLEVYGMWVGPVLMVLLGIALASLMFLGISDRS